MAVRELLRSEVLPIRPFRRSIFALRRDWKIRSYQNESFAPFPKRKIPREI